MQLNNLSDEVIQLCSEIDNIMVELAKNSKYILNNPIEGDDGGKGCGAVFVLPIIHCRLLTWCGGVLCRFIWYAKEPNGWMQVPGSGEKGNPHSRHRGEAPACN